MISTAAIVIILLAGMAIGAVVTLAIEAVVRRRGPRYPATRRQLDRAQRANRARLYVVRGGALPSLYDRHPRDGEDTH